MDARALAVSALFHVCVAGALGRAFTPAFARHEEPSATISRAASAIDIEIPDAIEVDAPKPRPNGSLAGSDLAGAVRASGPNRATDGERGEETPSTTTDARFGMVALLESSRQPLATGADTTWAPRAGGGADGLYAGSALGDGVGTSGLGIGAARDGLGIGMGTTGALGLSGTMRGVERAPAWRDAWRGGYTSYVHYGDHHRRMGPRVRHPVRLAPIGPLDGAVVLRFVRSHDDALVSCYRKSLATHPDLAGDLIIDFMIAHDGKVVATKDGGGHAGIDGTLVRCMTSAFGSFEFPEAPAPTRVSYTMKLETL